MLECIDLRKAYGDNLAINKINFTFTEGVYGLLGPNGAGKSTWIKILTSSIKATSGKILWNGTPIDELGASYISLIGYVPQNQVLFPFYTGSKFLYYMAALKGVSKAVADKQIPYLLSKVNLLDKANNRISTYSGGMKQRLLIAQAFLGDPAIIIMDEPTAGLDPKERIRMRNLISEMTNHKIVLIATHVVSDIEYISKEILLLKKGEIIGSGSSEILEKAIEPYVYERPMDEELLDDFMRNNVISAMRREDGVSYLRYLSENDDREFLTRPTLDDVYLYHFREEESHDME